MSLRCVSRGAVFWCVTQAELPGSYFLSHWSQFSRLCCLLKPSLTVWKPWLINHNYMMQECDLWSTWRRIDIEKLFHSSDEGDQVVLRGQRVIFLFVFVNQLRETAASCRLPVYGPRLCKWVGSQISDCSLFSTLNVMFWTLIELCSTEMLSVNRLANFCNLINSPMLSLVCWTFRHLPQRITSDWGGEQTRHVSASDAPTVCLRGADELRPGASSVLLRLRAGILQGVDKKQAVCAVMFVQCRAGKCMLPSSSCSL